MRPISLYPRMEGGDNMKTLASFPGVGYYVSGSDKELKSLSFELLELSDGDTSPKGIQEAKKALAKRKLHAHFVKNKHLIHI